MSDLNYEGLPQELTFADLSEDEISICLAGCTYGIQIAVRLMAYAMACTVMRGNAHYGQRFMMMATDPVVMKRVTAVVDDEAMRVIEDVSAGESHEGDVAEVMRRAFVSRMRDAVIGETEGRRPS